MSKMCQKSSKLSKKTRHEKSKGSSGVENESKTCKALRKWTKAKTSLVMDFRFEKIVPVFPITVWRAWRDFCGSTKTNSDF